MKELILGVGLAVGAACAQDGIVLGKKIADIDCTKDYPTNLYCSCGSVVVTNSAAGKYRQAGEAESSRFGYRYAVRNVGKPHFAVVTYPDDRSREMAILDGTCYDLNMGILTGDAKGAKLPLTMLMKQAKQVFWPRWSDATVFIGNTEKGLPGAAARIEIYEIASLTPFTAPAAKSPRRVLGVSYEDPCSHASDLGATEYGQWVDRAATFLKYAGLNRLTYPIIWYHGPLYPSKYDQNNYFDWSVASPVDRKIYLRWTTHPGDWVEMLLTRFDKEGLEFVAQSNYMRLSSLMEKMSHDDESVRNGADTINAVSWEGHVQTGTHDWTGEYNVKNFALQCEERMNGKDWQEGTLPYGEKPHGQRNGPIFNCVHPIVQEALLRSVREIAERYGKHPSFKGMNIFAFRPTLVGFGTIDFGYDDTTTRLFTQETGIAIPLDNSVRNRFAARQAFLVAGGMRAKWVAWRCKKVTELVAKMRDQLVAVRPDLVLGVALSGGPDAGIDEAMLSKLSNVSCTAGMECLDACTAAFSPASAETYVNANIFNTWIERWGNYKWWKCAAGEPVPDSLRMILGKPAEGMCRMGSFFEKDNFWWPDCQMRITPAYFADIHFLRHYAYAVALYDPLVLNRGGLTLDRCHGDEMRVFAAAWRALPAKKFETVGDASGAVVVRTLLCDNLRYVYAVNRRDIPKEVTLTLASSEKKFMLSPYGLHVETFAPESTLTGFTCSH